jgi:hypothetical protein
LPPMSPAFTDADRETDVAARVKVFDGPAA